MFKYCAEVSWEQLIGDGRGRRTSRFSVGRAEVRSYEPISEKDQLQRKEFERSSLLSNSVLYGLIGRRMGTQKSIERLKRRERCEGRGGKAEKKWPMIRLDYVLT